MPAALSKKMKKQARGREPVFCCIGSVLRSFKCLLQIGDDISVSSRLTARRIRRSEKPAASISSFVHMECVMEAGCWMSVPQSPRLTASAQMHVVEHLLGFLEAAHLERDNAAEPRHLADGHGVIGMVLQTGIEHFLHILGDRKSVV